MKKLFFIFVFFVCCCAPVLAQQPNPVQSPIQQQPPAKPTGTPATESENAAINQAVADYERAVALAAAQREAAILRVYSKAKRSVDEWLLQPGQDGRLYWVAVEAKAEEKK